MKKMKILEEWEESSMVSCRATFLCIEKISTDKYLLNVRQRETLGNWEEMFYEKVIESHKKLFKKKVDEIENKHGEIHIARLKKSGELNKIHDDLYDEIVNEMDDNFEVKEINGQKVFLEDEWLVGEKLECYNDEEQIIFSKVDTKVLKLLSKLDKRLNNFDKEKILKKINSYILK